MKKFIIAMDQGTTSSRAVLFDEHFNIVDIVQYEFTQYFPKEGYVEHDPYEIISTQFDAVEEMISRNNLPVHEIAAIGITNQRETTVVWDKTTGKPIYNAIVWQCRRTADICLQLQTEGWTEYIKQTTGLIIDAYFSATKIKWLLDNVEGARAKAEKGKLLFGTIDSWLIYNMTKGLVHVTDYTNASRTMIFDIHNLCWDKKLCDLLTIPVSMLPEVKSSSELYGYYNIQGVDIPITSIAGDQQAALFGHKCINKGDVKNTYGTGCFMLVNTGTEAVSSEHNLLTTIAAVGKDMSIQYALEGSVFTAGAVVQWLRDELEMIESAGETEGMALAVEDTAGVVMVPAFTGLGAPYWDMYARGTIVGITRGTRKNHIVRAALESIAYQTDAVLKAIEQDIGHEIKTLRVDGGASANEFLIQFQSDISNTKVVRPSSLETTALGVAYLAGLGVGMIKDISTVENHINDREYLPLMNEQTRKQLTDAFDKAVVRSKDWVIKESP
ncbi:MAG: glycerol kinase GlpK [Oscillospiraceae bacterium]|nr:glycerol kinase GlpK [Oscillospiraceae bacterium]